MAVLIVTTAHLAAAQVPPFPFGFSFGDIFTGPSDEGTSSTVPLPQPMPYFGKNVVAVHQGINGFLHFFQTHTEFAGSVNAYFMDMDTRNGGVGQNELWLRVGTRADDVTLARDIIAGNGTIFIPQVVVVATWFKVEAFEQRAGPQNTFQLIIAYSATGTAFAIFAYSQLEFFESQSFGQIQAQVFFSDAVTGGQSQTIAFVDSTESMERLLNETNCNRTGVYVFEINKGGPTEAPTPAPTDCGLFGGSLFCPLTLCGLFGRALGLCEAAE